MARINARNGSYYQNTYCENVIAIHFGLSTPSQFGYGVSAGNTFQHETLLGNGQGVVSDDPNVGTGQTPNLVNDPLGVCPAR